jgi:hypothetical protein
MLFDLGQQNAYIWHMVVCGCKNEWTKLGQKIATFLVQNNDFKSCWLK